MSSPRSSRCGLTGDVFLPPNSMGAAMHGDRVLARITHVQGGRAEGEIRKTLRRAHPTVVGEYRVGRRQSFVVPHDNKLQKWVLIPDGMELPAPGVNPDRIGAAPLNLRGPEDLDGLIVNVEIVEHPTDADDYPVGRVIEDAGASGRLRRRCGGDDPQASPAESVPARRCWSRRRNDSGRHHPGRRSKDGGTSVAWRS
ncbi:MAG: hypothetical protein QM757_40780 [Paludibaculum sp.]